MKKWEYGFLYFRDLKGNAVLQSASGEMVIGNVNLWIEALNKVGALGWEMVNADFDQNGITKSIYLKRPIE